MVADRRAGRSGQAVHRAAGEGEEGVRDDYHIPLGLERAEALDAQLAIQNDVRAMRKAITFGQRDSALINRCLRVAEHNGLSSEETMVLLAYNALCQMEEMWCRQLKLTMLDMRAPLMRESADNQWINA